jgi:hypothetical protein
VLRKSGVWLGCIQLHKTDMYRARLAIHMATVPDCGDRTTPNCSLGNLHGNNQYFCVPGPAVTEFVQNDMGVYVEAGISAKKVNGRPKRRITAQPNRV